MPEGDKGKVVYYDTLDALLMALNAGDIDSIEIFQSVARYLCASSASQKFAAMTEAEQAAVAAELETDMTEEEIRLMRSIGETFDFASYGTSDNPEGMIITEPYFSDVFVPVNLAGNGKQ